jgi:hypothetical protein
LAKHVEMDWLKFTDASQRIEGYESGLKSETAHSIGSLRLPYSLPQVLRRCSDYSAQRSHAGQVYMSLWKPTDDHLAGSGFPRQIATRRAERICYRAGFLVDCASRNIVGIRCTVRLILQSQTLKERVDVSDQNRA